MALELSQGLVVLTGVEDADAAIRGASGQEQAVEVQRRMVDHVLVLGVDFLQQAHHLRCNIFAKSPGKLNKCKSCFFPALDVEHGTDSVTRCNPPDGPTGSWYFFKRGHHSNYLFINLISKVKGNFLFQILNIYIISLN